MKTREDLHYEIELPEVGGSFLIIEYLSELGYCKQGMNGAQALDWVEVQAWSNMTGANVEGWVSLMLMRLSRDYANQSNLSRDPSTPEPYENKNVKFDMTKRRADVAAKLRR